MTPECFYSFLAHMKYTPEWPVGFVALSDVLSISLHSTSSMSSSLLMASVSNSLVKLMAGNLVGPT